MSRVLLLFYALIKYYHTRTRIIKDIQSSFVINSFKMRRSHHTELRLLLTFLYIYLNCNTFVYVKQVVFHYSLLSSPFKYPYTYIHIRAIVGGCVSFIYRCLLIYALWRKMADLLLISILFLTALISLRLIFDFFVQSVEDREDGAFEILLGFEMGVG